MRLRISRWQLRDLAWRAGYWLVLAGLTVLAGLRYLAIGAALWLHRWHHQLADRGQVLAETLGATDTYEQYRTPDQARYQRMAQVILIRPTTRRAAR